MKQHTSTGLIVWSFLVSVVVLFAGSGSAFAYSRPSGNHFNPYVPIFTNPQVKLAETASSSFTFKLLANADSVFTLACIS